MAADAPYTAQLKTWDEEQLLTAATHVKNLTQHPGWDALTQLLEQVHGNALDRLLGDHAGSHGRVMEQAEYARIVGFLSGLRQPQVAAQAFQVYAERVTQRNETQSP